MISIVCPVLIAEAAFPTQRDQSWVSTPVLILCGSAVVGWTIVMGTFVSYFPPASLAMTLIMIVAGLMVLALIIRAEPLPRYWARMPRPFLFGIVGGIGMTLVMVGTYMVPNWSARLPADALCARTLSTVAIELVALLWLSNGGAWTHRHRMELVIGLLAFFLLFGVLKDLKSFAGHSLVSGITLWML